jgi:hypothetical protein
VTKTTSTIDADTRALIVRQLGAALAEAYRRQYSNQNDERPERLDHAAGRDVRGGDHEHDDELFTTTSV